MQVTFPTDVAVSRVTILGNRDPNFPKGYSIMAGKVEFFDAAGKQIAHWEKEGTGPAYDYNLKLDRPLSDVRSIRFTVLGDQDRQSGFGCVAISEFQVE